MSFSRIDDPENNEKAQPRENIGKKGINRQSKDSGRGYSSGCSGELAVGGSPQERGQAILKPELFSRSLSRMAASLSF